MPLTPPATHLHTLEKFMCQLLTPPRDYPPHRESPCSFITAIPQVRFISKRRGRCGGEVCRGGEGTAGWAFLGCRIEEKLLERTVNPGKVWESCLQVC